LLLFIFSWRILALVAGILQLRMEGIKMITVKQAKEGAKLPAPIYKHKAYVILNKDRVVLHTLNDIANVGKVWAYYDDCQIDIRRYDLHLNDNTKL
jgi:hypothetical protein